MSAKTVFVVINRLDEALRIRCYACFYLRGKKGKKTDNLSVIVQYSSFIIKLHQPAYEP